MQRAFRKLIHFHSLPESGIDSPVRISSQSASSSPSKTSSMSGTSFSTKTSSQSASSTSTCMVTAFNVEIDGCTEYAATVTSTSYTDCGDCAITTDYLPGPAMVCDLNIVRYNSRLTEGKMCTKITTATGATTTTALVCAPTPTCTKAVLPTFGSASSATCTNYISTVTQTVTQDCGGYPGCAVVTEAMGHGPVSRISVPRDAIRSIAIRPLWLHDMDY